VPDSQVSEEFLRFIAVPRMQYIAYKAYWIDHELTECLVVSLTTRASSFGSMFEAACCDEASIVDQLDNDILTSV
jgi:hypothetical protein